jgi:hypothetical protein
METRVKTRMMVSYLNSFNVTLKASAIKKLALFLIQYTSIEIEPLHHQRLTHMGGYMVWR